MSKAIQAKITLYAVASVDDSADLLMIGDIVPTIKKQLYHKIKRTMVEKAEHLTEDDLKYETIVVPELKL